MRLDVIGWSSFALIAAIVVVATVHSRSSHAHHQVTEPARLESMPVAPAQVREAPEPSALTRRNARVESGEVPCSTCPAPQGKAEPIIEPTSPPAAKKTGSCGTCPAAGGKAEPVPGAASPSRKRDVPWTRILGHHATDRDEASASVGAAVLKEIGARGRLTLMWGDQGISVQQIACEWSVTGEVVTFVLSDGFGKQRHVQFDRAGRIPRGAPPEPTDPHLQWVAGDVLMWSGLVLPLDLTVGQQVGGFAVVAIDERLALLAQRRLLGEGEGEVERMEVARDAQGRVIRLEHAEGSRGEATYRARRAVVWPATSAASAPASLAPGTQQPE